MFVGGNLLFHIGAPLLVGGSIKARNNGKAIKAKERELRNRGRDITISFGITNNGAGVVLRL
jgi:hypothetical protein